MKKVFSFLNMLHFGHKRLSIVDIENGKQPMRFKIFGTEYIIIYNGQLYNTKELKEVLTKNGFIFTGHSDTEVLLKSYIHYGENVCKYLNGIFGFAVWNSKTEELFVARDQFGIKPLYYSKFEGNFIFASEIKSILAFPGIKPILNSKGISELFGIGPAHSPGCTPFKGIFELEPAHYMIINKNGFYKKEYWHIQTKPHEDDFETTCEKIRFLIKDSVERQLVSDVPLCTLLSGGLDSSIITAVAANYYKNNFGEKLNTFSVDYVDQEKNFVKNDFQPDLDDKYIDLMVKTFRN